MENQNDETKAYLNWLREHSGYQKKHGIPHREPVVPKPVKISKKILEEQEFEMFKNEYENTVSQIRYENEKDKRIEDELRWKSELVYEQAKSNIKVFNKFRAEFKILFCFDGKVPVMKDFPYDGTNFDLRNLVFNSNEAHEFTRYVCCPIFDQILKYSVTNTYVRKGKSLIYIRYLSDQDSPKEGAFFVFKHYQNAKLDVGELVKKDDGSYHYMTGIKSLDHPYYLDLIRLNTQKSIYERLCLNDNVIEVLEKHNITCKVKDIR
jgi:hypothetical protein